MQHFIKEKSSLGIKFSAFHGASQNRALKICTSKAHERTFGYQHSGQKKNARMYL